MRAVSLALIVLMGFFALSAFAVDSSLSASASAELSDPVLAVHSAVEEAEQELAVEEPMYDEDMQAFLEMEMELEGEGESDADADSEMEDALGLDADAEEDALFLEMEAEFDAENDADADVEVENESDADAGSVTVTEGEVEHEQDEDPIVTQQMEVDQALHDFGFVETEADAEAEVDADVEAEADAEADAAAEAEAEAEADAEADAEVDAEAEVGEEQTAVTKCGKKITWERNQEPNPEAPAAQAAQPEAPVQA